MSTRAPWLCRALLAASLAQVLPMAANAQDHVHIHSGTSVREAPSKQAAIPAMPATPATPAVVRKHDTGEDAAANVHDAQAADMGASDMDATDMSGMDMSGMDMPGMDMPAPAGAPLSSPADHSAMTGMSVAPTAPATPVPVLTDADRTAAMPPSGGHAAHDNSIQHRTLVDRLEAANADSVEWDAATWVGTDLDRLWLRTEGTRVGGRTQAADLELLYGRSVATWWDVVAGVRHDFNPGAAQDFVAFGVMGTAPYKIETRATVYIGQGGQTAARVDAEYETLLTNRLILQPRVEVNLFGQDDSRRGIGSGLSTVEAGLRLRYEVTRRFAPYIGITRERAFGSTAAFRRASGDDSNDTRLVAGVRLWF